MPSPSSASRPRRRCGRLVRASPRRAPAVEIIAVTTRDDFLLEIGEALSGFRRPSSPVDSVATALEQIAGSRKVQLLAVDVRGRRRPARRHRARNAQAPHIVTLVFANAEAEKQTAFALKGTNVFAVLSIPVDKRKTAAVLEGAVADATARRPPAAPRRARTARIRASTRIHSITVESAATDSGSYGGPTDSDSGSKNPMVMIGGGIAAWSLPRPLLHGSSCSRPPRRRRRLAARSPAFRSRADAANHFRSEVVAEPAPVVDMALVNGTVDELLEKARLAMRERRYTEPNGDNALLYYRSAAKADPSNGEAGDGLKRVASVLSARFDEVARCWPVRRSHPRSRAPEGGDAGRSARHRAGRQARHRADQQDARGRQPRPRCLAREGRAAVGRSVGRARSRKWRSEINRRQDEARQKRLVDLAQERIRDGRLDRWR